MLKIKDFSVEYTNGSLAIDEKRPRFHGSLKAIKTALFKPLTGLSSTVKTLFSIRE